MFQFFIFSRRRRRRKKRSRIRCASHEVMASRWRWELSRSHRLLVYSEEIILNIDVFASESAECNAGHSNSVRLVHYHWKCFHITNNFFDISFVISYDICRAATAELELQKSNMARSCQIPIRQHTILPTISKIPFRIANIFYLLALSAQFIQFKSALNSLFSICSRILPKSIFQITTNNK